MPSDDPKLCEEINFLKHKIEKLEDDVSKMNEGVTELLDAWKQGIGVAKFVKVMVWLIAAIFGAILFFKEHVRLL